MKRGKALSVIFIGILILMSSIIGVYAGWMDLFTEKPVSANVKVSGSAVAPEVIYVSAPNRTNLLEAQGVLFSFNFLAYSSAGVSYLPTSSEASRIFGDFNGSYGGVSNAIVNAVSCTTVSDTPVNCVKGTSACMNYTCNVLMYYYYDPITWGINASIVDDTGKIGNNHSMSFPLDDLKAWDRNPTYVNWTGVTTGGALKASDNNVNINLTGNKDIDASTYMDINATTLYKLGDPTKTISGSNFTSPATAPCTGGVSLVDNDFVSLATFFAIDHTASTPTNPADKDLLFCIKTLTNIETGEYETDSAKKWGIRVPAW
ncbi:MAG: hypothetical protein PHF67_04100 [Candidatus Nanoarchaeia archaeon]|nr:hypothetical protein [Candidatus Nanoarchaeia archaeon]